MTRTALLRRLPALLFGLLLLTGCRTYGGYDSEALTYEQILEANRVFAEELVRRQAGLEALTGAVPQDGRVAPFAETYAALVSAHEAALEEHLEWAAELSADSEYRVLNRTLGAIAQEQILIRLQAADVLRALQTSLAAGEDLEELPSETTLVAEVPPAGRYAFVPPAYERFMNASMPASVESILRGASPPPASSAEAEPTPATDAAPTE